AADVGQPAAVDDGVDAAGGAAAVQALDAGAGAEGLGDAHLGGEGAVLRHVADAAAHLEGVPEDVEAVDGGGAGSGRQEAGKDPHGGGLAGAVGPEEADDAAARHVEGDVADGGVVAVELGESVNVDHGGNSSSGNRGSFRRRLAH